MAVLVKVIVYVNEHAGGRIQNTRQGGLVDAIQQVLFQLARTRHALALGKLSPLNLPDPGQDERGQVAVWVQHCDDAGR